MVVVVTVIVVGLQIKNIGCQNIVNIVFMGVQNNIGVAQRMPMLLPIPCVFTHLLMPMPICPFNSTVDCHMTHVIINVLSHALSHLRPYSSWLLTAVAGA